MANRITDFEQSVKLKKYSLCFATIPLDRREEGKAIIEKIRQYFPKVTFIAQEVEAEPMVILSTNSINNDDLQNSKFYISHISLKFHHKILDFIFQGYIKNLMKLFVP